MEIRDQDVQCVGFRVGRRTSFFFLSALASLAGAAFFSAFFAAGFASSSSEEDWFSGLGFKVWG